MKALVVDDEKLIVKGLKFSLEQEGYEVDCAYDGQEAVDKAKETEYDIVLLDFMLPILTGYEVCQHPQAVGDVCPLLVRQATLGWRQSDGIGGRLVRAKSEVMCELLGGLPGVQIEQFGGEVDGIAVGSTAKAVIIGVVQLHAGVAVRMERTAHHAMAVGLHAVHLSHLPNGDGGLDLLI